MHFFLPISLILLIFCNFSRFLLPKSLSFIKILILGLGKLAHDFGLYLGATRHDFEIAQDAVREFVSDLHHFDRKLSATVRTDKGSIMRNSFIELIHADHAERNGQPVQEREM